MLHDLLGNEHNSDTLNWSDIAPILLISDLDLITDFEHITKFQRFP